MLTLLLIASVASAQAIAAPQGGGSALKLCILPFADATASGNRTAVTDVARTMLSEVVHSTSLQPRMLPADDTTRDGDFGPEKAIALGRGSRRLAPGETTVTGRSSIGRWARRCRVPSSR
jgi:hypothetical protein